MTLKEHGWAFIIQCSENRTYISQTEQGHQKPLASFLYQQVKQCGVIFEPVLKAPRNLKDKLSYQVPTPTKFIYELDKSTTSH